jgi:hypothetical protein
MIKDLLDYQGAIYGGEYVPITIGIHLDDLKKDDSPSSQRLLQLAKKRFTSRVEFDAFVRAFMTAPTGTALGGTLSW